MDKVFPQSLKVLKDCPNQLYAIGNLELLNSNIIAVVGSRKCSEYGRNMAEKFTRYLAERNITIISGMALGIDSIAHKETIKTNGNTIAVLGSGFNNIFPPENEGLYREIINNNGLIITEHAPHIKPSPENFSKRNRIISGLSLRGFSRRSWV